jgi:integrase
LEDDGSSPTPLEKLAQHMGLTLAPRRPAAERAVAACYWADAPPGHGINPTVRDLSTHLLETYEGDDQSRESAKRDLRNHILPRFGQLRVEEVSEADLFAWLAAKVDVERHPAGTDDRLHSVLNQIWALAAKLGVPGASPNPLERRSCSDWRAAQDELLTSEAALKLLDASLASPNRQLKFIFALMMTTGVRQGELLKAEWCHIDIDAREWNLPDFELGKPRKIQFDGRVAALLSMLPRSSDCPYLIANPKTKQPFRSVQASWEAVKTRAGFPHIELDDLRYCAVDHAELLDRLGLGSLDREQNEEQQVSPVYEEAAQ